MKINCLLVAIAIIFGLAACDGVEGRKEKYLEQAQQSFATEDYDKARINYKNVLKIDPKDLDGLIGYAETLEKLQDWRGAVGKYRAVLELEPDHTKAKVKLGQLYLMANESEMALDLANQVLENDPTHTGGLTLKAGALGKTGEREQALSLVEQAFKLDPNDIDTIIMYASMLTLNDREDEAVRVLEEANKSQPESISINSMLAQYYMGRGQFILAEEKLKRLIELDPDNVKLKHKLVAFYEKLDRPEQAEQVYFDIIESGENVPTAVMALHDLYVVRKDLEKAESILKKYMDEYPDNFDIRFKLADFYVRSERQDEAKAMYTSYLDESESVAVKARNRLAYLNEMQGNLDQAEEHLAAVLKDHPGNISALTLRGKMHLDQEDAINAISDLRTVLNANPENTQVLKWLASAYVMNNEPELAVDMLKAALSLQPRDIQSRLRLAGLYKELNNQEQVTEQLAVASELMPGNLELKGRLVSEYLAAGNSDKARALTENLRAEDPENPVYALYLGISHQLESDHQQAINYFDQALAAKPGAIEPMSAKVRSLVALKEFDQAIAWLDEVIKEVDQNSPAHNFRGELYLAKREFPAAESSFSKAAEINPGWWLPYRNLAIAALAQDDMKAAESALSKGIEKTQGNQRLRMELAGLYERQGALNAAIDQYEAILQSDTDNLLARNNLAMLLVSRESAAEADIQRAYELSQGLLAQSNPLFQDTMGWVHYAKGEYNKALPLIKRALGAYPNNPEIQYHLGMTYYKTSDYAKAKEYLAAALQTEGNFRGRNQAETTLSELEDKVSSL